jgi:hypothetical protein
MSPRYNLVLAYGTNLNPMDFERIAEQVRAQAPDIMVYVAPQSGLPSYRVSTRPTLIFCPQELRPEKFPPGKIYCGRRITKTEQMRVLARHGIPVPRWKTIMPGAIYTHAEWGPIVVTKPSSLGASYSRGVAASRPEDVTFQSPASFPKDHPGHYGPMLIQRFINTGLHPAQIRVLTLFGEPLYAEEIRTEEPQPLPEPPTADSVAAWAITPGTVKRVRSFVNDNDVLRLARRAYGAFPDVPLHACDILREEATGRLFILEINSGGNTWHFSSKWGQFQRVEGRRREEQFDAFKVAARVLVERTRNEAR